jgi:hypothetical protein
LFGFFYQELRKTGREGTLCEEPAPAFMTWQRNVAYVPVVCSFSDFPGNYSGHVSRRQNPVDDYGDDYG